MKLTKTQSILLDDMQQGRLLHFMPSMGRFNQTAYFYTIFGKKCTQAARALISHGLVEAYGPPYKKSYRLTEAGKTLKIEATT